MSSRTANFNRNHVGISEICIFMIHKGKTKEWETLAKLEKFTGFHGWAQEGEGLDPK